MVDEEDPSRLRSAVWSIDDPERYEAFRKATEAIAYEQGMGLPGRVAASGRAAWVKDVREEQDFIRGEMARDLGVGGSFQFPVLIGTEVAAVLEFFSARPEDPDAALLAVMSHVGEQPGRTIERGRSELVIGEG